MLSSKYCVTVNNPDITVDEMMIRLDKAEKVQYACWSLEKGDEKKTPHWQMSLKFKRTVKSGFVNKIFKGMNFNEPMKGTFMEAEHYCTKDPVEGPWVYGKWVVQGQRNDIEAAVETVKTGVSLTQVAVENPVVFVKYHAGITKLHTLLTKKRLRDECEAEHDVEVSSFSWLPWQSEILSSLDGPADRRKIHWFWEPTGNVGKSTMCRHLGLKFSSLVLSGAVKDMADGFVREPSKVIIFDLTRVHAENVDHLMSFAESLKNGFLFSPKYEGGQIFFPCPHIFFFANCEPPSGKWSADRYSVRVCDDL